MKVKIFEQLKTKYSHLGFSKEVLESVATQLSTFVTEEDKIATAVEGAELMLKSFQSFADSRVTSFKSESEKAKKEAEELKAKLEQKAKGEETPKTKLTAESISALIDEKIKELVTPVQQKLTEKEKEEQKNARAEKIKTTAKELQIPEWRIKEGFVISDEADDETIKQILSEVKKNITTAGLEKEEALPLSTSKEYIQDEAKSFAEQLPDK